MKKWIEKRHSSFGLKIKNQGGFMMRKSMGFAVVLVLCFLCSPVMAEEIAIVGTGAGTEIIEELGKAFGKDNAGVTILAPKSIGSGGGIKAVGTDGAKLGRVGRGIKDNEKGYGLTYLPIARLPIVIMAHKGVAVKNLTPQQICDIFAGKTTNWKEVGGKEAAIRVVRREDGDSSLEVLQKTLPGFKAITITAKSKTALSDPETLETVAKTAGAISFGTYPNTKVSDVATLTIGGKSPDSADYPYVGDLGLVFKEKNKSGNIAKFVEFVSTSTAQEVIKGAGGLSL
jgi:phosphate transport system substrate-binding protein